jgi:hypothetical protein
MRTYTQNRRRTQPQVESLEGKSLLSGGSVMHQVVPHVTAAPIVAQATAAFSGTLMGSYSSVHAPFFANIQSYVTSGTLSGAGSTRLLGTLFVRSSTPVGRFVGQLLMRNTGGSMIVNVFQSAVPGTYSYKVALANGTDSAFKGGTGTLVITQIPTFSSTFFAFGQSTMTFSLG